jgi:hypothetical protein
MSRSENLFGNTAKKNLALRLLTVSADMIIIGFLTNSLLENISDR